MVPGSRSTSGVVRSQVRYAILMRFSIYEVGRGANWPTSAKTLETKPANPATQMPQSTSLPVLQGRRITNHMEI
jgi:hypothetical protein